MGSTWIGLLDECGGHTQQYHIHEPANPDIDALNLATWGKKELSCYYNEVEGEHSKKIGLGSDTPKSSLYGKYEKFLSTGAITPDLDVCGGHVGVTPDSNGQAVYHYHVQSNAPFTFGCRFHCALL